MIDFLLFVARFHRVMIGLHGSGLVWSLVVGSGQALVWDCGFC